MSKKEHDSNTEPLGLTKEDVPRFLVMLFVLTTGVFLGFAVYLRIQGLPWSPIAVITAMSAAAAYVSLRWMRRTGMEGPIFQARQSPARQEMQAVAEEKQAERDASLALEEKIIYLRFLDEFQQALRDLDQTGECQLPKSLLKREKVEADQVAGIMSLWISEDFDEIVDIRSTEISRGKVRFFDPKWSEHGPYSAPSDAGSAGEDE